MRLYRTSLFANALILVLSVYDGMMLFLVKKKVIAYAGLNAAIVMSVVGVIVANDVGQRRRFPHLAAFGVIPRAVAKVMHAIALAADASGTMKSLIGWCLRAVMPTAPTATDAGIPALVRGLPILAKASRCPLATVMLRGTIVPIVSFDLAFFLRLMLPASATPCADFRGSRVEQRGSRPAPSTCPSVWGGGAEAPRCGFGSVGPLASPPRWSRRPCRGRGSDRVPSVV